MTPAEAIPLVALIAAATGQRQPEGAPDAWALLLPDIAIGDALRAVQQIAAKPQPHERRLTIDAPTIRAQVKADRAARIDQALATWEPPADPAEYLRELRAITAQAGAGELDTPHQKPQIGTRRDDIMRRAQQAIETI